jgi:hypothetical protein
MPMVSVILRPGVNTQLTPAANEAGVSQSQLIRYDGGIIQTFGGWENYNGVTITSTVRDLHAFKGFTDSEFLALGATGSLSVYDSGDSVVLDITPQTELSNTAPNFSVSSGSDVVTVVDGNFANSVYNTVFFNTPVAIGNLLLNGAYHIASVTGSSIYTIISSIDASTTVASSGILPEFTTSSDSAVVTVELPNNNFQEIPGLFYDFIAPTTVGGLTVQGPYEIASIIDSTSFTINAADLATSSTTATMNSTLAQLLYYVTLGPQPAGAGYGGGGYGLGGYGTGVAVVGEQGTPITATDWTLDNWGGVLLACPEDGAIYTWSENSGFTNADVIHQAPFFNGGIYVSMPQQIVVAWRSCQTTGVQAPLIVRWCDAGDFTNWVVEGGSAAGSFTFPNGSNIVGALQAGTQGVIWTDVDVWVQQYIGGDLTFSHNKVGTGCGLIGSHAAAVLNGVVYWMGNSSFYFLTGQGIEVLACPVWDFVFQNLSTANASKVRCATNSLFNEVTWFFPSATSMGENDSYVKYDVQEQQWDYGTLPRTAWCDASLLGNPFGTDNQGILYQHETGTQTTGVSLPFFRTGWWSITDGNDLAFVDFVMPDFIWGTYSGAKDAQVNLTFYSVDYPGDAVRTYGPYTVTQATQYITPRIRGRMLSVLVQSQSQSFWRLGRIRYRWAPIGRR